MTADFDAIVIGAGAIGLSCARALALKGQKVLIIEKESRIASHGSARNSEVIHAGLYYSYKSLKRKHCIDGATQLYAYLQDRNIDFKRCGKLVIANGSAEEERLYKLRANAEKNGVKDLRFLSPEQLGKKEPDIHCSLALHSPHSGIFDSHGYALSLLADVEANDGLLALNTQVHKVEHKSGLFHLHSKPEGYVVTAPRLINAAGIWAEKLAHQIDGLEKCFIPKMRYVKGHYAALQGVKAPFQNLIYPLPDENGLGIHVTLDLAGQCRFGPDTQAPLHRFDYSFEHQNLSHFYKAVRRYWPSLPDGGLAPSQVGLRPQIDAMGASDFTISSSDEHGAHGLICLFAMDSPGLTASLSIGDAVAELLD